MKPSIIQLGCVWLITTLLITLLLYLGFKPAIYQQTHEYRLERIQGQLADIAQRLEERFVFSMLTPDNRLMRELEIASLEYGVRIWMIDTLGESLEIEAGKLPKRFSLTREDMDILTPKTDILMKLEGNLRGWFAQDTLSVGRTLLMQDGKALLLYLHYPIQPLREQAAVQFQTALFWIAGCWLASSVMLFGFALWKARQWRQIIKGAQLIAHGQYHTRIARKMGQSAPMLVEHINSMAHDLEKNQQLAEGFIANVSHELRTPLTSMHGFIRAMMDGMIEQADYPEYLAIVEQETLRLTRMVNEWLDLSMLDSGQFPLQRSVFPLQEWIRRVIMRFEPAMQQKHLESEALFTGQDCLVDADMDRMEQVLGNLLDNAIKFSPQGGRIKVWAYTSKGTAYVIVEDNGPGVPKEDLPYIWERFYKANKAHTPGMGSGLGLSIAKRIITQHGQRIWATSREGEGMAIIFTLPVVESKKTG